MTTETIHHSPSHSGEPLLIFLLPGNPGLVSYYRSYLAHLHSLCASALPRISTTIHACSLSGFSTTPHNTPLLDLNGQIAYMDAALGQAWNEACAAAGRDVKVVLLGHSVGAYMLLELVRRRRGGNMRIVGGVCLTPTVVDLRGSPSGQKVGVSCLSSRIRLDADQNSGSVRRAGSLPPPPGWQRRSSGQSRTRRCWASSSA